MNDAVFGKSMKNVRKHRDINLVTANEKRTHLVSDPNYQKTKWFSENLLAVEMRRIKVKMNKPVYLGLTILEISKTLNFGMIISNQSINKMQNYVTWIQMALLFILKLKMFMNILQMLLKKDLIHEIIKSIDNYQKVKIRKLIGLMKDELGGKIVAEFVARRPKPYSYLMDDRNSDKKLKEQKMSNKKYLSLMIKKTAY